MTLRRISAEGQANGTVVTAGPGNSGADAYLGNNTSILTFDTTAPIRGSGSFRVNGVSADTAILALQGGNDASGSTNVTAALTTLPGAAEDILTLRSAGSNAAKLGTTASNSIRVMDALGNTLATLAGGPMVAGTAYRWELAAVKGTGTTDGQIMASWYANGSTTPLGSYSASNVNAGTANITEARCGKQSTGAALNMLFDDFAYNNGSFAVIGLPAANAAPNVSPGSDVYVEAGQTISLSGLITDTDGTVTAAQWQSRDADSTGSWTNVTTSTSGLNTSSCTATASPVATVGVTEYRLNGTDNSSATGTASVFAYVYPAAGTDSQVRFVTGSWTNGGTTPAADLKTAVNDNSDASWAQTAAGPVNQDAILQYYPVRPGDVTLKYRLQVDQASPTVPTTPTAFAPDGTTQLFQGNPVTPATTAGDFSLIFDSTANGLVTDAMRKGLKLRLRANTN